MAAPRRMPRMRHSARSGYEAAHEGPTLEDLPLVLAGGYPPEYVSNTSALVTAGPPAVYNVITTCPTGVWRVIMRMACYTVGACTTLWGVRRLGVVVWFNNAWYAANTYLPVWSGPPFSLRPGDDLVTGTTSGAGPFTQISSCAYVDVRIV